MKARSDVGNAQMGIFGSLAVLAWLPCAVRFCLAFVFANARRQSDTASANRANEAWELAGNRCCRACCRLEDEGG